MRKNIFIASTFFATIILTIASCKKDSSNNSTQNQITGSFIVYYQYGNSLGDAFTESVQAESFNSDYGRYLNLFAKSKVYPKEHFALNMHKFDTTKSFVGSYTISAADVDSIRMYNKITYQEKEYGTYFVQQNGFPLPPIPNFTVTILVDNDSSIVGKFGSCRLYPYVSGSTRFWDPTNASYDYKRIDSGTFSFRLK